MQLATTLGLILNSRSGKFIGLTPDETSALHECLAWLRQPGNNPLCFYGAELEAWPIGFSRTRWRCSGPWMQRRTVDAQSSSVFCETTVPQPISTPTERLTIAEL